MGKKAKKPKPTSEQKELERLQVAELRRTDKERKELEAFNTARGQFGRRSLIATSGAGTDANNFVGATQLKPAGKFFFEGQQFDSLADVEAFKAKRSAPKPRAARNSGNQFIPGGRSRPASSLISI